MSEHAQRPPEGRSLLEQASEVISEVMLFAVAVLVGLGTALMVVRIGVLSDGSLMLGSLMLAAAALAYLALEQIVRETVPVRPLIERSERASVPASALIALGAIVVAMVGSTLLSLLQEQLGLDVSEQDAILKLVAEGDAREHAMLAISAVVLAPLTEELLFRHMLFRRLFQRAGPTLAWALPAVAFSLFHFNPSGVIVYVWLGLVFAWAYLYTGRVWVAMAVHAGHNGIALALLLWMPEAV